jgi:hypothetical protein
MYNQVQMTNQNNTPGLHPSQYYTIQNPSANNSVVNTNMHTIQGNKETGKKVQRVGSNYKRHGSIGIDTTQTAFSTAGDASNFNNGL